jgi:hypothetical protein
MTTTAPAAFAACEALFTASPDRVTDEGDAGQVMPVTASGRPLRLVRHDTAMGRFYRLYPVDGDLAVATVAPEGDSPAGVEAYLAAAVPA